LQGAINVIEHLLSVLIRIPEFPSPPGELVEASRNKMLNSAGIHLPSGWSRQLLDLCDEFVLQQGKGERIDLFEYRRGFYRGMSLALLLLSASLLVKCSLGHTVLTIPATANASTDTVLVPLTTAPPAPTSPPAATNVEITAGMLTYSAVCFLLLSMLLCVRYLRFARHRVRVAVAGFLALKDEKLVASSASDT
jgi:hypothetical protein